MRTFPPVIPFSLALVVLSALFGCTVHLVSDYDEQTDTGLSQLNTDVTTFVNKMIANAGQTAGTYDSNKDFYVNEDAKIDTLIVRAEAHKALNSCPTIDVIKKAVTSAFPAKDPAKPPPPIPFPDVAEVLMQINKDECSVVLLTLVKTGLDQLKDFHQAQDIKGIPAAAHDAILEGGLGSLIHAGITVEVAKKTGGSVAGNAGSITGGKSGS